MMPTRIWEIVECPTHPNTIIVLEDVGQQRILTFSADRGEARRLTRMVVQRDCACHPIYDFVHALRQAFEAQVTRVGLEDAKGQGIGGRICVRWGQNELAAPCYPPDPLALALRAQVPIYAPPDAIAHGARAPLAPGPVDGPADVARVRPEDFSAEAGSGGSSNGS
jgi:bifunctional DNase/RNase